MHSQIPPIVHRDIKVNNTSVKKSISNSGLYLIQIENFLLGDDKQLKLCDFGSSTRDIFSPTLDWNAQQRNTLEDQVNYKNLSSFKTQ